MFSLFRTYWNFCNWFCEKCSWFIIILIFHNNNRSAIKNELKINGRKNDKLFIKAIRSNFLFSFYIWNFVLMLKTYLWYFTNKRRASQSVYRVMYWAKNKEKLVSMKCSYTYIVGLPALFVCFESIIQKEYEMLHAKKKNRNKK